MAWRTVVVSNPARLRVDNDRLVISQEQEITLPLEDIAVLVIESQQVLLTSSVMFRLAEYGGTVLVCGANHLPAMAGLSMAGNCRLSGIQRTQLATSLPFRKRCWQRVVQQKIRNQGNCLRILGRDGADALFAMANDVESGDSGNVESHAARVYFRRLFGDGFSRGDEDALNSSLNYGYAVLRGAVARSLTSYGLLLTQGIHHNSELNPFNLADDFIEPLRPVADLIASSFNPPPTELSKEHKARLVSALCCDVLMGKDAQSVLRSTEMTAASFASACRSGNPGMLKLPEIIPIRGHRYE